MVTDAGFPSAWYIPPGKLCAVGTGAVGGGHLEGVFLGRRLELGFEEGALHVSTWTELL